MAETDGPRWERDWPDVRAALEKRFAEGHLEYGDGVFFRPLPRTIAEQKQEALDIMGWGFIAFCRLADLERLATDLEGDLRRRAISEELDQIAAALYGAGRPDGPITPGQLAGAVARLRSRVAEAEKRAVNLTAELETQRENLSNALDDLQRRVSGVADEEPF